MACCAICPELQHTTSSGTVPTTSSYRTSSIRYNVSFARILLSWRNKSKGLSNIGCGAIDCCMSPRFRQRLVDSSRSGLGSRVVVSRRRSTARSHELWPRDDVIEYRGSSIRTCTMGASIVRYYYKCSTLVPVPYFVGRPCSLVQHLKLNNQCWTLQR